METRKQLVGESIVRDLLWYIGEDPARQGLVETPARVVKAWLEWFDGYSMNEVDVFKVFEDGAEDDCESCEVECHNQLLTNERWSTPLRRCLAGVQPSEEADGHHVVLSKEPRDVRPG